MHVVTYVAVSALDASAPGSAAANMYVRQMANMEVR